MTVDLECCGERMSLVPASAKDWPITRLMHCYYCGHYEPWDVDEDTPVTGDGLPQGDRP
ncbi:hypothetical protein ACIRRA_12920 [Nocardia sp. NPDC101769]|uniref:hypothetical protein n=1 Tax=Nocardia sp. NPDC101769 TaxID=3364333 RepID=UPI00380AC5E4